MHQVVNNRSVQSLVALQSPNGRIALDTLAHSVTEAVSKASRRYETIEQARARLMDNGWHTVIMLPLHSDWAEYDIAVTVDSRLYDLVYVGGGRWISGDELDPLDSVPLPLSELPLDKKIARYCGELWKRGHIVQSVLAKLGITWHWKSTEPKEEPKEDITMRP